MTLFHYGGCIKCNCMKNDVRVVLSNLFNPNICEHISNYNDYCRGCSKARKYENEIIQRGMVLGWCKMEMIMAYFCCHKPDPFDRSAPKNVRVNAMNQLIDKHENENKLINKILKRYFKEYYKTITEEFIPNLYSKKKLKDKTMYFQLCSNGEFYYNRKTYLEKPLILKLLVMYVIELIGCEYHLVDTTKIKEYISDHIWSIFDD